MAILTELTDGVFHPVNHLILKILKAHGTLSSREVTTKLKKQGITLDRRDVSYALWNLSKEYGLVTSAGWKQKGSRDERVFKISDKALRKALTKAERMIAELK